MFHRLKKQWKWLAPLLFLLLFLPFSPKLDLLAARASYPFSHHAYFNFMYKYGELFGFVLFFGAFFFVPFRKTRRGALLVILTIGLGAGVITNSVLKKYIGRPRPKQLTEFGGTLDYRAVWQPNFDTQRIKQKSFPSGHVAMGFSSLALVIAFKRRPYLKAGAIFLTVIWGGGLIVARIAQGGHFLSDTLVSPCLMWWVALSIDKGFTLLREQRHWNSPHTRPE